MLLFDAALVLKLGSVVESLHRYIAYSRMLMDTMPEGFQYPEPLRIFFSETMLVSSLFQFKAVNVLSTALGMFQAEKAPFYSSWLVPIVQLVYVQARRKQWTQITDFLAHKVGSGQ